MSVLIDVNEALDVEVTRGSARAQTPTTDLVMDDVALAHPLGFG